MKINPFKPNSPSRPGMFVGRLSEIERIESSLIQTRANQNVNFLLTGERGIGKTSLLNLVKFFAEGSIEVQNQKLNFLVVETDISKETTQAGLIKKIELGLRRKLSSTEKIRNFFSEAWGFMKKLEVAGSKINELKTIDNELIFEEFAYSIADTVKRITENDSKTLLDSHFDGVMILIDEADNACKSLDLGAFIKLLLERVQKEGTEKLMFGLAGLPKISEILMESHESSIRLFDCIELGRLEKDEINKVIERILESSVELNKHETKIDEDARAFLTYLSEGFPHFIHQYGYSAFDHSDGFTIKVDDVGEGAFGKSGALEIIGNKYYKNDYYKKIQGKDYRQVLNIMADSLDNWVTKKEIQEKFNGQKTTLNNAIQALTSRGIILPQEGRRGVYRLQDKGFAWWIKLKCEQEEKDRKPI